MAIQALKKYLMDDIQDRTTNSREHDIRYVITLPAIWDVGANQFMREAAIQAGICSDLLFWLMNLKQLHCGVHRQMKIKMNEPPISNKS
ncbi:hypothetical protein DPMN_182869 [Dreissena polymorpha]|uniref:Uncharacterized protein n=1 Tax=Dreissena polymorpha TaxID=45954 RepID=A0A9D4DFN3_DREPO|nr:hypothetical protein DPMN_182869 [Dreissena polymorpha]